MSNITYRREINQFINGLITDATELTFPENAALVWENMDLDDKGLLERRFGLDYESTFINESGPTVGTEATSMFRWENVAGDAATNFIVAQVDKDLLFYEPTSGGNWDLNSAKVAVSVDLTTYKIAGSSNSDIENNPCSFSSGNGKLYIVHPYTDVLELEYASGGPTITVTEYTVRQRDFDGEALVSPFDDLEHTPTVGEMTNAHWYNLANQGWANRFSEMTTIVNNRGTYPGNHEQWQFGKSVNGTTGIESFQYSHYAAQEFGNARAPQGHVIYDSFDKNVTVAVGAVGTATATGTDEATIRISTTNHGLNTSDTVSFDTATWEYDNGGGCGSSVSFDPNNLGNVTVTKIDNSTFDVSAIREVEASAATPHSASTPTTLRLAHTGHPYTTGDRILLSTAAWNFDAGGGCPGTAFDPSSLGWVTVTVIDSNHYTVPATLTGFVAWCTSTPASSVSRTWIPLFSSWCSSGSDWAQVATSSFTDPLSVRPKANAFFKGRHACSGVNAEGFGSNVYISKTLFGENTDPGRCYQDGDPTAEHQNTLVATDGMVINIQGMNNCVAMQEYHQGLILYASNGIWYIHGGAGAPFTAVNWTVDKISNLSCIGERNVVEVEDVPYFWAKEGVYRLTHPDRNALPVAESIIRGKVQTLIDDISNTIKETVKGAYNPGTNKILWIYEDDTSGSLTECFIHDLNFDCFYSWDFDDTDYRIVDIVSNYDYNTTKRDQIKFMTVRVSDGHLTYSGLTNDESKDWPLDTDADAPGVIETGYDLGQSAALSAQIRHVNMLFRRVENAFVTDGAGGSQLDHQGSCLMRIQWDWSDNITSGKWSPQREVYRLRRMFGGDVGDPYEDGMPVVRTKNKVRGSGHSIRLRFDTTEDRFLKILGWSLNIEERNTE